MVYAEARGTSDACQLAVASVIRNRTSDKKGACAVVSEGDGKQFNGYNTRVCSHEISAHVIAHRKHTADRKDDWRSAWRCHATPSGAGRRSRRDASFCKDIHRNRAGSCDLCAAVCTRPSLSPAPSRQSCRCRSPCPRSNARRGCRPQGFQPVYNQPRNPK